ncbi:hypothetical protein HDU91_003889 [Kappamyces sp. JEL0680]|nr:hypothetical protein HDU91_003889 [Kappamyces sp. JEL0680]
MSMDMDALVAMIEDPAAPLPKAKKTCSFNGCKEKLSTITCVPCPVCALKFCSTHRLPEAHSSACAAAKKKSTQVKAKNDAHLLLSMMEKNPKAAHGSSASALEKERADIKKRLREKTSRARK